MNYTAFLSTLFLAAVFATVVEKDINVIIERADLLVDSSNRIISEHLNNSHGHLLSSLQHEVHSVEKIAADLKVLASSNVTSHRTHEVNLLEERLVYHENRLNEELEFVQDVYRNYNATDKSANELVQYAERLIVEAKAVLAEHQGHGHLESVSLSVEVFHVTQLANALRHNHLPLSTKLEEEALVRHERTIRLLIERLQAHHV